MKQTNNAPQPNAAAMDMKKPSGEKSGTHAYSQKGKPKDLNWKSPNTGKGGKK